MLSSLEKFGSALRSFSPHLVIVSGLQMLDNFPFAQGMLVLLLDAVSALTPIAWLHECHPAVSKDLKGLDKYGHMAVKIVWSVCADVQGALKKCPNTKITISQKCANFVVPIFALLFITQLCKSLPLCAVFTWHTPN